MWREHSAYFLAAANDARCVFACELCFHASDIERPAREVRSARVRERLLEGLLIVYKLARDSVAEHAVSYTSSEDGLD